MFGNLFTKKKKLVTYTFEFDPNFETNSVVSVIEKGCLEDEYQAWIWDHYYAKTLYVLGNSDISISLKNHLEKWAEQVISGLGFPLELIEERGLLLLDKDMQLINHPLGSINKDVYLLEVFQKGNEWPHIKTHLSHKGYQNRLAYTVIVLCQYFINKNKEFVKEVPLHILSMRKYYSSIKPSTDLKSTIEAPIFAINESTETFNELEKELEQLEKELESLEEDE